MIFHGRQYPLVILFGLSCLLTLLLDVSLTLILRIFDSTSENANSYERACKCTAKQPA